MTSYYRVPISVLSLISLLFVGCSEFIEENLKDKKVILNSPAADHETNKYSQSFWWEPVGNTQFYRLQVVGPTFDSIAETILDTLVKSNRFLTTLDPGQYEWRVRVENSGSYGLYSTRRLVIHESSITTQRVQLKLPAMHLITNQKSITYSWYGLFGAEEYHLQIDTNDFSNVKSLVFDAITPDIEFTVPLTKDKQYKWRVRAELADTIYSKWSNIHTFSLDTTPPDKVELSSPTDGQTVSKPVSLAWMAQVGATKYQLVIYKSDGVTVFNSTFPLTLTNTSFSFTEGSFNDKLYWKVRAIDAAGNFSIYSDVRDFTVQ
ncbi:MAG TPA: hypothetical protein VGB63_16345 [Pedobacter sp.]|jgi:hypothetical protein